MSTRDVYDMTPEELRAVGERAVARLDAWLADVGKLENPIEGVLDDVSGFADELMTYANGACWMHAKSDCLPCIKTAIEGLSDSDKRLRELWEARA